MPGSKSIRLADGRQLGYEQYGPPDGKPLFFFHGNPGSRLDMYYAYPERLARQDLRIIAPDRPGIGPSTFQPGRRFLDYAADMCSLADALGLGRFAAVSVSTGSAYLAETIPDCRASFYPGKGHFSLLVNKAGEFLEELVPV